MTNSQKFIENRDYHLAERFITTALHSKKKTKHTLLLKMRPLKQTPKQDIIASQFGYPTFFVFN